MARQSRQPAGPRGAPRSPARSPAGGPARGPARGSARGPAGSPRTSAYGARGAAYGPRGAGYGAPDDEFDYEYAYVPAYRRKSLIPFILAMAGAAVLVVLVIAGIYLISNPGIFNPEIRKQTNIATTSKNVTEVAGAVEYLIEKRSFRSLVKAKKRYIEIIRDEGPKNFDIWQNKVGAPLLAYFKGRNLEHASELEGYVYGGGGDWSKTQKLRNAMREKAADAVERLIAICDYDYFMDNMLDYMRAKNYIPPKTEVYMASGIDFKVLVKWDGMPNFNTNDDGTQTMVAPISVWFQESELKVVKSKFPVVMKKLANGEFVVDWTY